MRSFIFVLLLMATGIFLNVPKAQKPVPKSHTAVLAKKQTTIKAQDFIKKLLSAYPLYFDTLVRNKKWQIQVIYTQIDRKAGNFPVFTDYYFNVDSQQYFYPASTVKMPTALLALQRIKELNLPELDKSTTMITEKAYSGQAAFYNDPQAEDGRPTIENYIKKIFLVSDNDAFNRLYEFLGQEYINNTLHQKGFHSAEILHRLNISLTEDENRHTNPVTFYNSDGKVIYRKPAVASNLVYNKRKNLLGKAYYQDNHLINKPFDFSKKNRFALTDLHEILKTILFPEAFPSKKRFDLAADDYPFIYRYMSMKPGESVFPQYDTTYNDSYSKFILYGSKDTMDPSIRIFNKEGDAYGFLTDIAYVVDFKNNVEFMLSADILCNSDEIFYDDQYDYEKVGYPFMKNLGKAFYNFELKRKRKTKPDLSKFKLKYTR